MHSTAAEIEQQIDPDQIARVEIARHAASEQVEVRVFVARAPEPYLFEFQNMGAAIEFYERLWSRRTVGEDDVAASSSA